VERRPALAVQRIEFRQSQLGTRDKRVARFTITVAFVAKFRAANRDGDECLPLEVPENARADRNSWHCNKGSYRDGDECLPLEVPENAEVLLNSWHCKRGYRSSAYR